MPKPNRTTRGKTRKRLSASVRGLRTVALFEGAKGILVLLTGFGLLSLLHKDLGLAAEQLVRFFHLNPARHYPAIFVDAVSRLTDPQLWAMSFGAMVYSAIRIAEAVGLWLERRWAEWLGLVSSGMYLPIELYEVSRAVTWHKVAVLVVNAGVVLFLLFILITGRSHHKNPVRR